MPDIATLLWQSLSEPQQQIFNVTVTLAYSRADIEACLTTCIAWHTAEHHPIQVVPLGPEASGKHGVPESFSMRASEGERFSLADRLWSHLAQTSRPRQNLNYRTPSEHQGLQKRSALHFMACHRRCRKHAKMVSWDSTRVFEISHPRGSTWDQSAILIPERGAMYHTSNAQF